MPQTSFADSFHSRSTLDLETGSITYFRLPKLEEDGLLQLSRLPYSWRVLLEFLLRGEDGYVVTKDDVMRLINQDPASPVRSEIAFKPSRVVLQDFTGVPAVVDLAALRSAMQRLGGDPQKINPEIPVDLVIDHSVQVDVFGSTVALQQNSEKEFERNRERYSFLRWGQNAFQNLSVVPPASGIVHQVNLEYLARVVQTRKQKGETLMFPDSLVGTDSHTTMINGLGVLGWGVGGIEAEAVMLGQPLYLLIPEVVGVKLSGRLSEGVTATDLVLTITQMLREKGVVEKFVEFFGPGLSGMSLPDRATIANMAPEYGATVGYFPVDKETLDYLRRTGRPESLIKQVEQYMRAQQLFRTDDSPDPVYADTLELDLSTVKSSLAGPKRPQDRIELENVHISFQEDLDKPLTSRGFGLSENSHNQTAKIQHADGQQETLGHGSVVIAAITSCTNTSNPSVMLAAGLLAKKAVEAGLQVPRYVKTSLAPGSRVVTDYLDRAGLTPYLEKLGFYTVGYGCTTCIGNSGPLPENVAQAIQENDLIVSGVLSGNRNFEGRINPLVKANYLASPPLVVAYAIAGTVNLDITTQSLGKTISGDDVFLKDIWPSNEEIQALLNKASDPASHKKLYEGIESSNAAWNDIPVTEEAVYEWDENSSYIQEPPFFMTIGDEIKPIEPIRKARALVKVGHSVTTDHISPAGAIPLDSPTAEYLKAKGIKPVDFNTYGSRRGNDRVMTRGTFGNIRLKNELAPGTEGGWTTYFPTDEQMSIYEAAEKYKQSETPTVVIAGKDYGMGSSRDWAAKGTYLLGVKAVIAESFERIHRSNLVGMGVLPLQFKAGETAESLGITGSETFHIEIDDTLKPGQQVTVKARSADGCTITFQALCRIDTPIETDYYRNGGILHTVLRNFLKQS